mmetsp:Transcript_105108/g.234545  ORF Transcript_105108/g.234545 Transcript_105108/m.234545 type:complete len:227 (-) Transcript_105108:88-768(-)
MLVMSYPESVHLCLMFLRRIANEFLKVLDALSHSCVLRMIGLEAVQLLKVAGMGAFESLQLRRMLLHRVPEQLLDIIDSILQGGMPRLRSLESFEILDVLPKRCLMLPVRSFQQIQGSNMLVSTVANDFLQVPEAFPDGGMVHMGRLKCLQLPCMLTPSGVVLHMGLLKSRQLLGVLLSGIPKRLLEVLDTLLQGSVMRFQRRLFADQTRMCRLEIVESNPLRFAC